MSSMKVIFQICLFFVLFIMGPQHVSAATLTTGEIANLIHPIEHHAMQYGEGKIKAYVFIDPKCPYSRSFISMIYDNQKMLGMYHYYIFFYELKRFNTHKTIGTIYTAPSPLNAMLEIMVGGKNIKPLTVLSPQVEEKIGDIESVAQQLNVTKRPYLIIAKEWN
jgi:hypothetical protein